MAARKATSSPLTALAARRPFSVGEIIADGVVHGIALTAAVIAGTVLITLAGLDAANISVTPIAIYIATLVGVLAASFAYNLCPLGDIKAWLARVDQAAIFLFIAGTYTPLLAVAGGTALIDSLLVAVWAASVIGVALKLLVPARFGRIAILLYLAIGWSGVVAFQTLAATLPAAALWLIVGGGVAYSAGIVFHLWEKLRFQNVVWHGFVTLGATLHLIAVYFAVLSG